MQVDQYADQYEIHFVLGEGGQASVYLGSKNNQMFALKVYLPGLNKISAFQIEVDFLSKLNYKHLINIVDSREKAKIKIGNKPEQIRPLIVLQLAEGGELFQFLSKQGRFTSEICRSYLKQLISAVRYLVDVGVTHRDLKPQNILFDREFTLKVSDFGLARDSKGNHGDGKLTSKVGTEGYKPPEMEQGNYTGLDADMFACGVILFIMYNGTPPFLSTKPNDRIYGLIKTKNFPKFWALHEKNKPPGHFPDSLKRLLNSFLSSDKDRRPTFEQLQKDEWLNGDEAMLDQVQQYMSAKEEQISQNDPNKLKIKELRDLFLLRAQQEDNCAEDYRDNENEEEVQKLEGEELFANTYRKLQVNMEDLPQYEKSKVSYINQKPAFIVAWIQTYLKEQSLKGNTFLEGFAGQIEAKQFNLEFNKEKGQMNLKLNFVLDGEDDTYVQLQGQLHRSTKNQIGIEWQRVQGNSVWLNSIESSINNNLKQII